MAYSTGNPPSVIWQTVGGTRRSWLYESSQAKAAVFGTTFFSNGRALGMKVNDLMFVLDNKTNIWYSGRVASSSTNGSMSLGSTSTVLASSK